MTDVATMTIAELEAEAETLAGCIEESPEEARLIAIVDELERRRAAESANGTA